MPAPNSAKHPAKRPHTGGRVKIHVDMEELDRLVRIGCRDNDIAAHFGLSETTLQRRFGSRVSKRRSEIRNSLREKQVDLALAGDRTMLIWLGKNMIGQSDKADITSAGEALKVIVERIG